MKVQYATIEGTVKAIYLEDGKIINADTGYNYGLYTSAIKLYETREEAVAARKAKKAAKAAARAKRTPVWMLSENAYNLQGMRNGRRYYGC